MNRQTRRRRAKTAGKAVSSVPPALQMEIDQLGRTALAHHQAGRFAQAEDGYRRILSLHPGNPEANHLLGLLAHQDGDLNKAEELIRAAIHAAPDVAAYHSNLGNLLKDQGNGKSAVASYRKAIKLDPDLYDAHSNLGAALHEMGKLIQAEASCRRALLIDPEIAVGHSNLGNILKDLGKLDEALASHQRALGLAPEHAGVLSNLAATLRGLGRTKEAERQYRRSAALDPANPDTHAELAVLLTTLERFDEAEDGFSRALELDSAHPRTLCEYPVLLQYLGKLDKGIGILEGAIRAHPTDSAYHQQLGKFLLQSGQTRKARKRLKKAYDMAPADADLASDLGLASSKLGMVTEAIAYFESVLDASPGHEGASLNLAMALFGSGQRGQAVPILRGLLKKKPKYAATIRSGLVRMLQSDPAITATDLLDETRLWDASHDTAASVGSPPYKNDFNGQGKIRVAYMSADLRGHSVSYFLEPILRNHDRSAFEIFCYHNSLIRDETTDVLRSFSDNWRDILGESDDAVCRLIRDDVIDLLVDLSGHTAGNRLGVFAAQPSPVQVTYLGYPGTTGLKAISYRISDPVADPVGESDAHYAEALLRLPNGFLCYQPNTKAPSPAPPPSVTNGYVTFASFNNLAKMNMELVRVWMRILDGLPQSRLLLKSAVLVDDSTRHRVGGWFSELGLAAERLMLMKADESLNEHLGQYGQVDVALDTFPYNGTTTTCEALWMGVPVVTLFGERHAGRVGASLLTSAGLEQFIAGDEGAYVDLALSLARDQDDRSRLRLGLRGLMAESSLMDGKGFTRELESQYKTVWRHCCNRIGES